MNAMLFAQTFATVCVWSWLGGIAKTAVCVRMAWIVATFFGVHATTHKLGQWTSDGKTRILMILMVHHFGVIWFCSVHRAHW